tara:strand:- start:10755 stop:11486 length:732 start_codon:yes stop_codon:yes gene_type:complete
MTLALVIIGQMRTYNYQSIILSYKKHLAKNESIDLYIFTWNKVGSSNRHGNHNIHKRMNDKIEKSDILEYYKKYDFINIKHVFVEDYDKFVEDLDSDTLYIYKTPYRNHGNISTCVPAQYKYQQAARYLSNLNDIDKYSNIIIARPDICFITDLPILDTKIDNIYYKSGAERCIDHCWYGKPETIIKQLFNIFDNLVENTKNMICLIHPEHNRNINELIHFECEKKNIKINFIKKSMVKIIYF